MSVTMRRTSRSGAHALRRQLTRTFVLLKTARLALKADGVSVTARAGPEARRRAESPQMPVDLSDGPGVTGNNKKNYRPAGSRCDVDTRSLNQDQCT
jgi:hypothetical protein